MLPVISFLFLPFRQLLLLSWLVCNFLFCVIVCHGYYFLFPYSQVASDMIAYIWVWIMENWCTARGASKAREVLRKSVFFVKEKISIDFCNFLFYITNVKSL